MTETKRPSRFVDAALDWLELVPPSQHSESSGKVFLLDQFLTEKQKAKRIGR